MEGKQGRKGDAGPPGPRGDTGDRGPRGRIGIIIMHSMAIYSASNFLGLTLHLCMHVCLLSIPSRKGDFHGGSN